MDGWPIAHHVFAGNRLDQTTVGEVVDDLQKRFELGRVVFVGDRGRVNVKNLEKLRKQEWGYVVGLQRRRRQNIYEYIQEAEKQGQWQDCPVGITAEEKATPPKTRVQEVAGKEPGVRVFVVHSEEREQYERGMRQQSMERARQELEALQRVEKGDLKEPEKIGAAAARGPSKPKPAKTTPTASMKSVPAKFCPPHLPRYHHDLRKSGKIIPEQHNICTLPRHVGTRAHRDADARLDKGWRIVMPSPTMASVRPSSTKRRTPRLGVSHAGQHSLTSFSMFWHSFDTVAVLGRAFAD